MLRKRVLRAVRLVDGVQLHKITVRAVDCGLFIVPFFSFSSATNPRETKRNKKKGAQFVHYPATKNQNLELTLRIKSQKPPHSQHSSHQLNKKKTKDAVEFATRLGNTRLSYTLVSR
jgi:hypothetical protein